jgi:hypothetical protein
MTPRTQPHVGDAVRLTRSGHSAGCGERGTVVAVLGKPGTEVLRVKWSEHLETFVPAHVAEVDQDESSGNSS